MSREAMRTHIVVPKDLVASVDELVGRRSRSKFFTDAAEEKLARVRLARAAKQAAGSLANTTIPGWETSETAVEWVRASRRAEEAGPRAISEDG